MVRIIERFRTASALALACAGPAFGAPQAGQPAGGPSDDPAPRPTEELLERVLRALDRADPDLLDEIARHRDEEALGALQTAVDRLYAPALLDRACEAFVQFRGVDPLERKALRFLSEAASRPHPFADRAVVPTVPRQRAAVRGLRAFGSAAMEELEAILDGHADLACRRIAIGGLVPLLHARRTPAALEQMIAWYRYPVSGTRELGVRTLRVFDGPVALEHFARALGDEQLDARVKSMILEALGEQKGAGVVTLALDGLRAEQPEVQLAAIRALAALGHAGHVRELERMMRSKEPAVRRAALVAQSGIRAPDQRWRAIVLDAARSRDYALRMGAAAALARLGDSEALPALLALVEDDVQPVRAEAVEALAGLRRADSLPVLIERLRVDTRRMQARIQAALVLLTGLDLGDRAPRWSAWWEADGASFVLPTLGEALAAQEERAQRRREERRTVASFYGIPIDSDRVCFVLDVSGSMDQTDRFGGRRRLERVQEELANTLTNYPDGALFNLIFFSDNAQRWKNGLLEMTEKSRKAAIKYVHRQRANGATALYDAVVKAFEDPEVDTIILLSDGEPTAGALVEPDEILADLLRRNDLRQVVIHTVSVNRRSELLEQLSAETGGVHREVN